MKSVRIRHEIKAFLSERPRNTAEILEHINTTMRHGTTSQQLGNVLFQMELKEKDIVKVGHINRSGILSGGYDICIWALTSWLEEFNSDWKMEDVICTDPTLNIDKCVIVIDSYNTTKDVLLSRQN